MRRKFLIREIRKRFECQRCNLCCKAPGFVYLSRKEAGKIAKYLKMTYEVFMNQYCRQEAGRLVLVDGKDGCIFLNDQGCQINEVKPKQCQDFPHKWRDPDAFDYCEGIKRLTEKSITS